MGRSKKDERIGLININTEGTSMEIVRYTSSKDMVVKFLDSFGYEKKTCYKLFKNGNVKNPYDKTVLSVGYLGVGKYPTWDNKVNKNTRIYSTWKSMLERCYDPIHLNKQPAYKDVIVCNGWHNFQNFAEWYEENYYQVKNERMHLEKDILIKGNNIYSPETCIFSPESINYLFIKIKSKRGTYPIGVILHEVSGEFRARCQNQFSKKYQHLGLYDTPELAFYAYKDYKENHIKEVADHYKELIPEELYDAMYRYKVEITD